MAEDRDRTELRDDLPEEVKHPNATMTSGRGVAVAMVLAAVMLIAIAIAVTVQ